MDMDRYNSTDRYGWNNRYKIMAKGVILLRRKNKRKNHSGKI